MFASSKSVSRPRLRLFRPRLSLFESLRLLSTQASFSPRPPFISSSPPTSPSLSLFLIPLHSLYHISIPSSPPPPPSLIPSLPASFHLIYLLLTTSHVSFSSFPATFPAAVPSSSSLLSINAPLSPPPLSPSSSLSVSLAMPSTKEVISLPRL